MNALLSIKPEFVEKIFSGEKRFEFRKSAFREDVSRVVVYATSPVCRIVGEFEVEDILQASPRQLWQKNKGFCRDIKKLFLRLFFGEKECSSYKNWQI